MQIKLSTGVQFTIPDGSLQAAVQAAVDGVVQFGAPQRPVVERGAAAVNAARLELGTRVEAEREEEAAA